MLIHLIRCLKGYVVVRVYGYAPERFLNLCSNNGILIWDIRNRGTCYEMKMSIRGFRNIRPYARKTKTKIMIREKHGLPFFIFRNRKRKTFFAGMLLCMALLYVMSLFIWDIRIEGCIQYTPELLTDFLEDNGVRHGMKKKEVNAENIQFLLRNQYPDITWASVSVEGTRLLVKIQEDTVATEEEKEGFETPCDLVSPEDGVITEMIVRQGTPQCRIGDTVQKGDILVSGRLEIRNVSKEVVRYEYVRADADVYIEYEEAYHVVVERTFERRIYTGEKKKGVFLKVLSKELKLSQSPEAFLLYDTVTVQNQLKLLDNFYLPVFWGSICFREYELKEDVYSEEETEKLLRKRKEQDFGDLEKKGVQITENNVKIQIGKTQGTLSGTLLLRKRAKDTALTEQPEDPVLEENTKQDG